MGLPGAQQEALRPSGATSADELHVDPVRAWDWFAAERIAVAVSGNSATDLDDAHAILIHLHQKVPTSLALASAIARGVPHDRLWQDDRFLAAVWTTAANKLTDLRRAAARRRSPRFRRPNGTQTTTNDWGRHPPHFRIVSTDSVPCHASDPPGFDVTDDSTQPDACSASAETASVSRQIVREAIGRLRHADATVLNFVYRDYDGAVHGTRVDEALAAHLTSTSDRPVSRDAARRRLTDSRVRLEDTIVGAHRHHLLHLTTVHGARLGVGDRTALVAYLSMVGKRPRNVVIEAAYATATASTDPDRLPWSDRKSFVTTLCAEVRALFRLHMDLLRSDGIGSSGDRRSASDEAPR